MTEPRHADTDDEIMRCFSAMSELRPHLEQSSFVRLVRHMQGEGYCLAYIEESRAVVAVAGYRVRTSLFMGRNLYVDDLVTTADCRSRGHGKSLLAWLRTLAVNNNCAYLHLDSGTQRHRAHRFYLANGLDISSFHFGERLKTE